jgi:predicted permease
MRLVVQGSDHRTSTKGCTMLRQEIQQSLRFIVRNPGFSAVAILSLALGIGANAAVFSLADVLLLRPLPVMDPGRVVTVATFAVGDRLAGGVSYPKYRQLRDQSQSFDGLIAFRTSTFGFTKSSANVPQARAGMMVSENFFRVLGVQPMLGRGFLPEDGQASGRNAVVVIDYGTWNDQFDRSTSIVGSNVRINGIDFSIIGVTPKSFTSIDERMRPAFYVPSTMSQRLSAVRGDPLEDNRDHSWLVKGRLKNGISQAAAQAELTTMWTDIERRSPELDRSRQIAVQSELQARARERPDAILTPLLMALVGLVLIIACANVANLLLGRARVRSREIAVRLALGVTRLRLFRHLLIESLLLSLVAAVVGLFFAYVGIRFFQMTPVSDVSVAPSPELDRRVLGICLLAALASTVFFGFAPAWRSARTGLASTLKSGETSAGAHPRTIGRNVLVVSQIALAMVLLVATGMLVDAFRKTLVLSPGFRTDHLVMMEFDTSLARYDSTQSDDFYRRLVTRAQGLPGVRSVTLTSSAPLGFQGMRDVIPDGYQFPRGQETLQAMAAVVDEHYFATTKTDILQGRSFTAADSKGSRRVAIVNEEFAERYWPGENAMGKRLRLNGKDGDWADVVGIARTGKYLFIAEPPTPFVYLPFAQNPSPRMILLAESDGEPASLIEPLRSLVHTLDVDQPVYNVNSFSSFYEQRAVRVPLRILQTVAAMGVIGIVLALVGIYALVSYTVARRTRDIGVRMAMGAERLSVLKMVLGQGLVLSALGIATGGLISVGVARLLAAGLTGLGTPSPATFVVAPVAVLMATMVACYVPARRASLVDPIAALRYE